MKRQLILIILPLLLYQVTGTSQKFYVLGSGGYSMGFLKNYLHAESIRAEIRSDTIFSSQDQNEAYPVSFGSGATFSFGIGTEISDYLSLELTGFYAATNKLEFKTTERYDFPAGKYYFGFNAVHTYKGSEIGFIPAIKVHSDGKKITPYAKLGILVALVDLTYDYDGTYMTDHPEYYPFGDESYTYKMKRNVNIGANVAVGVDFYLADKLSVFIEANGNFVNYIPTKAEYTKYILNGDDELSSFTIHEKESVYVKRFTSAENDDITEPEKKLKISLPFSTLGLQAGIRFNFYQ